MLRLLLAIFLTAAALAAKGPVYVVLWFDTEDYIEPAADDAALRIATDLEKAGVFGLLRPAPEPATVVMFLAGLAGMFWFARKRVAQRLMSRLCDG